MKTTTALLNKSSEKTADITSNTESGRKVFIKTYGCQMNVYDSERMADILKSIGFLQTANIDEADMVILNTCHIREKASEKVYSEIGRLRPLKDKRKRAGKKTIFAVAGCVAQAEGEEIMARQTAVDMVFGPQTYHRLPEMVRKILKAPDQRVCDTDFPVESKFDFLPARKDHSPVSAFLSIQEGCDKFCTFCVVPYTRGAEQSRPVSDILKEAKALTLAGVKEITLLGQNVNAYHGLGPQGKEWGLGRLIYALQEIEGLARIRYTTSHPRDVDDMLIEAHRDCNKLMPYLHLPVQSGSDKILKAMNRKHTADDYRRIIDKLRTSCPEIAFTSDFIVGFPGESDQDFLETLKLVQDVEYASSFSFKYSARPGTPAAEALNPVESSCADVRLQMLQQLLEAQQSAFNQASVGKVFPVLFEKPGRKEGQIVGRSPYLQPVHIEGKKEDFIGEIFSCEITKCHGYSLFARPVFGKKMSIAGAG